MTLSIPEVASFTCAQGNTLELAILKTLYYTGIRKMELIHLDLEDIDFERLQTTNITHMAEAGLFIREIQAQSGYLDIQSLIGYIQHTASRIRKGCDHTFKDLQETDIDSPSDNSLVNTDNLSTEHYRKTAFRKYLDGEIDNETLHSILETLDKEKNHGQQRNMEDVAYY